MCISCLITMHLGRLPGQNPVCVCAIGPRSGCLNARLDQDAGHAGGSLEVLNPKSG